MAHGDRIPSGDLAGLGGGNVSSLWGIRDGERLWVLDYVESRIYVYNRSTKARESERDFLVAANSWWIWSNGSIMWVLEDTPGDGVALRAYDLFDNSRDSARDVIIPEGANPEGMWSDGTTIWVALHVGGTAAIRAYSLADGSADPSRDIAPHADNGRVQGIWSDGVTMWAADRDDRRIYAYDMAGGYRVPSKELTSAQLSDINPTGLRDIWVDRDSGILYALDISSVDITAYEFEADRPPIDLAASAQATVTALAALDVKSLYGDIAAEALAATVTASGDVRGRRRGARPSPPPPRSLGLTPLHRPMLAGLVQRIKAETGLDPLLTFSDDHYDAFKLSDGRRSGPWCALKPTEFELSDGAGDGRGLATATRPNVWSNGDASISVDAEYERLGQWERVAEASDLAGVDGPALHLERIAPDAWRMRVRRIGSSVPALRDVLFLESFPGGPGASAVVRDVDKESDAPLVRLELEPDPGTDLDGIPVTGPIGVLRRRAEAVRLLMVPVTIRMTLIYATTDVDELLDFMSEWAFIRAKSRLDFNLEYLGRTLPIRTSLGASLSIPPKELPGESGSYQMFEGELELRGWLSHDDSRDAAVAPRVVDAEFATQLNGLDIGDGRREGLRVG